MMWTLLVFLTVGDVSRLETIRYKTHMECIVAADTKKHEPQVDKVVCMSPQYEKYFTK